MRIFFFIIVVGLSIFKEGIAKENLGKNAIRINFSPENLVIYEEGMFLLTNHLGEVLLDNVQRDKQGYFTICPMVFACSICHKQCKKSQKECEKCGSQELDLIVAKQNVENDYFTAEDMVTEFLEDFSFWEREALQCSEVWLKGNVDSDGNSSLSGGVTVDDKGKNLDLEASATIEKDSEGKTNVKGEFKVKKGF